MKYLALDVGTRRTGVAFGDSETGIPLPLETIHHTSFSELLESVRSLVVGRSVDLVLLGMPLLPSGKPGSQTKVARDFADMLSRYDIPFEFIDERYTTPGGKETDPDSSAACAILGIKLSLDR